MDNILYLWIYLISFSPDQDILNSFYEQKGPLPQEHIYVSEKIPDNIKKRSLKYLYPIMVLSQEFELDPYYVFSIVWTESDFIEKALSHKGARGVMQIMPSTRIYLKTKINNLKFKRLVRKLSLETKLNKETIENLVLGTFYLKKLNTRFSQPIHATAAYNMGPTWTSKRLQMGLEVGNSNRYVNKVKMKYKKIVSNIIFY